MKINLRPFRLLRPAWAPCLCAYKYPFDAILKETDFSVRTGLHNLAAGCTYFGICAPVECTLFQSIYIHYRGLNTSF